MQINDKLIDSIPRNMNKVLKSFKQGVIKSCIFNSGYQTLEEAWRACKFIETCVYVTKKDNIYYLRRKEDWNSKVRDYSAKTIEYECTGISN